MQWEILVEAPSRYVKLPRILRREMQVLSIEQAKAFLEVALPTLYGTLFALGYHDGNASQRVHRPQVAGPRLGARHGEREANPAEGKPGVDFGGTKRAGSRRPVRLQNRVLEKLKELHQARPTRLEDLDECPEAKT